MENPQKCRLGLSKVRIFYFHKVFQSVPMSKINSKTPFNFHATRRPNISTSSSSGSSNRIVNAQHWTPFFSSTKRICHIHAVTNVLLEKYVNARQDKAESEMSSLLKRPFRPNLLVFARKIVWRCRKVSAKTSMYTSLRHTAHKSTWTKNLYIFHDTCFPIP